MKKKPTPRKPRPVAQLLEQGMAAAIEVGECLEWQGKMGNGKTVPVVASREGRSYSTDHSVPRLLWEQKKGPIAPGMVVYRTCCNNHCVEFKHIAVGTRSEWIAHRTKLGLMKHTTQHILNLTKGARNRPGVVNNMDKARQVRALLADHTREQVAMLTGVSKSMVDEIARGRAWRDTASPWAGLMASNDSRKAA